MARRIRLVSHIKGAERMSLREFADALAALTTVGTTLSDPAQVLRMV